MVAARSELDERDIGMKREHRKRLGLSADTVRRLSATELGAVAGAVWNTYTECGKSEVLSCPETCPRIGGLP